MADYDFYVNSYLGSIIPQKAFDASSARAEEALNRFKGIYQVVSSGPESEKMAVCAMAEAVYTAKKHRSGVTAASVGNVSVHYEGRDSADKALWRELYEQASIYLDIYRGAGV